MRTIRRRWWLYVLVVALIVVGVVALVGRYGSQTAYLTAVDRATGQQRWRVDVPRNGAQWISQEDDQIVVFACDHRPHIEFLVDPTNGKILGDRAAAHGFNATIDSKGVGVLWKAPGPEGYGLPLADELSYDDDAKRLVSDQGWTAEVDASGPIWIPALVRADTVYFIDHAGGCTGFD